MLEFSRQTAIEGHTIEELKRLLHRQWTRLGEAVLLRIPTEVDATLMGAMLHEIAYAPAMTFFSRPSAADLMAMLLDGLRARNPG